MSNADKTQEKLLNSIRKTKEGVAAKAKEQGSAKQQSAAPTQATAPKTNNSTQSSSKASSASTKSDRTPSGSFPSRCRVWPD